MRKLLLLTILFISNSCNSQNLEKADLYDKLKNSVVKVLAYDINGNLSSTGSGVIINNNQIITNFHVFNEKTDLAFVTYTDTIRQFNFLYGEIQKDLLIVEFENKNNLPSMPISDKEIRIGEDVFIIGSPGGLFNSFNSANISNKAFDEKYNRNLIYFSNSTYYGNSGGALINTSGELIGITTVKYLNYDLDGAVNVNEIKNLEYAPAKYSDSYKYRLKALSCYNARDYKNSLLYSDSSINLYPEYYKNYVFKGLTYYAKGELGKAKDVFNKIIEINDTIAEAYMMVGAIEFINNNIPEAMKYFDKSFSLDSTNPSIYYQYALKEAVIDSNYKEAKRLLVKGLSYDKFNVNCLNLYSVILSMLNEKADDMYFKYIDAAISNLRLYEKCYFPLLYVNYATALGERGRKDEKISWYKKAADCENQVAIDSLTKWGYYE